MQIAVIGAGLVGVSTALELSKDGHEVSVFERGASIATEGSFAPHGAIVPGLLQAHPAWGLRLFGPQPSMNPAHWAGQLTRWRADRSERAAARRSMACDLARLGLQQLTTATDVEQLELEGSRGAMMMIRRPSDCARAQALADTLVATGERVELLSADGARLVEPALNGDTALAGALHWPHALSANCRQLAQALKSASQRLGARYFLQHVVRALNPGTRPGVLVMPASGGSVPGAAPQEFDGVVVCAAADSADLLRPLGIRLPWQAIHSCSVTAPLRDGDDADRHLPRGILLDPDRHVIVSRLGQRGARGGTCTTGAATPDAIVQRRGSLVRGTGRLVSRGSPAGPGTGLGGRAARLCRRPAGAGPQRRPRHLAEPRARCPWRGLGGCHCAFAGRALGR
jgi:D-amino-acid dehydrogenase